MLNVHHFAGLCHLQGTASRNADLHLLAGVLIGRHGFGLHSDCVPFHEVYSLFFDYGVPHVHRLDGGFVLEASGCSVHLSCRVLRRRRERGVPGVPAAVLLVHERHAVHAMQGKQPTADLDSDALFVPRRVHEHRSREFLHPDRVHEPELRLLQQRDRLLPVRRSAEPAELPPASELRLSGGLLPERWGAVSGVR